MRAAAFVLFASIAAAQAIDNPETVADVTRAAKSPYAFASFIASGEPFHWTSIWKALGVADPSKIRECGEASGYYAQCHSELITLRDQVIVRVLHPAQYDIYVRFLHAGAGWKFAGEYVENQWYGNGEYRIQYIAGRPFLLATHQGDRGTGIFSQIQDWFDLSQAAFEPVLALVKTFHYWMPPDGLGFEGGAKLDSIASSPNHISVTYVANFRFVTDHARPLYRWSRRAVYTKRGAEYVFDAERSEASEKDVDVLTQLEITHEQYLYFLLPALRNIAAGRRNQRRDWLTRFVAQCHDSPEKRELQALLEQRR